MKDQIINEITSIIQDVAKRENEFLMANGRGIFDLKEHAFVYLVGKEIMKRKELVFGTNNIKWENESTVLRKDDNKIERIDLTLRIEDKYNIVMEFKMDQKAGEFLKDVIKLKDIDKEDLGLLIFCKCLFENQLIDYKKKLKDDLNSKAKLINDIIEKTINHGYTNKVFYLLTIWKIK